MVLSSKPISRDLDPIEELKRQNLCWPNLSSNRQVRVQQLLGNDLLDCTEEQYVSTLQSLASLQFVQTELDGEFISKVEALLTEVLLNANQKQVTSLLRSLVAMQWSLSGREELVRVVEYAVNVHVGSLSPSDLSEMLLLLSKLHIEWSDLHSQVKSAIFTIASPSRFDHSKFIAALGLLGASWNEIPVNTRSTMIDSLLQQVPLSWDSLCDLLMGLRLLQVELDTGPLRSVLVSSLQSKELLPKTVSDTHYPLPRRWVEVMTSLPHFNFTVEDRLPLSSLLQPLTSIPHQQLQLHPSEVVSLLVSLAAMEVPWSNLSVEIQTALSQLVREGVHSCDCSLFSALVHSLSLLTFDATSHEDLSVLLPMHASILRAFDEIYLFLSNQEMQQCVVFLTLISGLSDALSVKEKINALQGWFKTGASAVDPLDYDDKKYLRLNKGLLLQIDQALTANTTASAASVGASVNYSVVQSYSPLWFSILPVDGAVFKTSGKYSEGELAAFMEVDGHHHYTITSNSDSRLRRKDALKQRLYSIRHPDVPYLRINGSLTTKADRRNAMKMLIGRVINR